MAVHAIKRGVSFYSYQEEYFLGQLGIEDCIRVSADFGALGIEIIPEQMMRGYPTITDDFYRQWHGWMDKYGTTPVASDLFIDTKKYPGPLADRRRAGGIGAPRSSDRPPARRLRDPRHHQYPT